MCARKCWDGKFHKSDVVAERKTIAGLVNESAVGMYLLRNMRRDEGFTFHKETVCRSFYAHVHGVSEHMCRKARRLSKLDGTAVWFKDNAKNKKAAAHPDKAGHAHAFWSVWFDRLCQRPNNDIRLFPADKSYREIWTDCFEPWWRHQGHLDSEKPSFQYWQKIRHHEDFKDVKRRAKHFHCRCTRCNYLKKLHLTAFTNALVMTHYQQQRRLHEEAVRAWRLLEGKLDAEACQCPTEVTLLSFDATTSTITPHLSNRPLKAFTAGGMAFTPWLITNHGSRKKEYIYAPVGKWGKGANYVITQLMAMLRKIKSDPNNPQHKARRLVMVADNAGENKNSTLLAWACDLVMNKWYDEVEILFGEVGHTHNGNDATHKTHNVELGRLDANDLGHLVWNYRVPWADEKTRPTASLLDVFYDWDDFYEQHVRTLSGIIKTVADEYIVRGFKASRSRARDGDTGVPTMVDIKWKADPATDPYWRGHDGYAHSDGFFVLKGSPDGVPDTIAGATHLQLPKYAKSLVSKKRGLAKQLAPWSLDKALQANYEQIITGVVPCEVLESTTPVGEWGALCTIGTHESCKGQVRFIKDVLFATEGKPPSLWGLPADVPEATSLKYHISSDDVLIETRPLPNIRYTHKENGTTRAKATESDMYDHPNNVAERAALKLHLDQVSAATDASSLPLPLSDGDDDEESEVGDWEGKDPEDDADHTFVVSMQKCVASHFVVLLSEDVNTRKKFIEVGKIKTVNKTNKTFTATWTQCTKDPFDEECISAGLWHTKPGAQPVICKAKSVVCYFTKMPANRKLPPAVRRAITKRKIWK